MALGPAAIAVGNDSDVTRQTIHAHYPSRKRAIDGAHRRASAAGGPTSVHGPKFGTRKMYARADRKDSVSATTRCYSTNIEVGARVFFQFQLHHLDVCRVRIGDYTQIGPAVQMSTTTHPLDAVERRGKEFGKPVEIGADV